MQTSRGMEELLLRIIVSLVDEPNEVHITSNTTRSGTMFQYLLRQLMSERSLVRVGGPLARLEYCCARWGLLLRSGMSWT